MEKRTLCHRCAQSYREAGYILQHEDYCNIREPCDLCSRLGYEYEVLKKTGGEGDEHC